MMAEEILGKHLPHLAVVNTSDWKSLLRPASACMSALLMCYV